MFSCCTRPPPFPLGTQSVSGGLSLAAGFVFSATSGGCWLYACGTRGTAYGRLTRRMGQAAVGKDQSRPTTVFLAGAFKSKRQSTANLTGGPKHLHSHPWPTAGRRKACWSSPSWSKRQA